MANSIQLMTSYVPVLDEKYVKGSLTSVLDTDPALIKLQGQDLKIPIMTTSGLRNHDRTDGGKYKEGNVSITYQTKTPNYSRNTKFTVDAMDDFETQEVAFGMLSAHFLDHEVTPEIDAFRFSKYFGMTNAGTNQAEEDITTGEEALAAVRAARTYFDEKDVPEGERYLFIRPTYLNLIEDLQTIESRAALNSFGNVVKTSSNRLKQTVTLKDDANGGFDATGDINFIAIHKGAVIQGIKHAAPKFIPAEANQTADGNSFAYRIYGIVEAYDQKKTEGIYASIPTGA